MESKNLEELLYTLSEIALRKSILPLRFRGWVAALGLHVQIRKAGGWTRLKAGGRWRSYVDAWCEAGGAWEIRKFDRETWERRFAHLVKPTFDIAEFLKNRAGYYGALDAEEWAILDEAILHYKIHGIWIGLPPIVRPAE